MRMRFVLPVAALSLSMSGCGGSASSAAAHSSAVRGSNLAAVARGSTSAAPSVSASRPVSKSGKAASAPLVDARGNPIIPAAAKAHTDAGAIAFTKYYIALLDYLDQHPDPRITPAVDDEDCPACDEMNALLKKEQQKGAFFIGNVTTLTEIKTHFSPDRQQVIVSFLQSKPARTRVDGPTKKVSLPAAKFVTKLLLLWEGGAWKVANIGADPV